MEKTRSEKIAEIAKMAHEMNRSYCASIGDLSHLPWDEAPAWQRESACMGVEAIIRDPDTNPEKSHVNWLAHKLGDGWRWGPVKDAEKKEHPCMVPYNMLPDDQRIKDVLFTTTVRMMVPMLGITAVS